MLRLEADREADARCKCEKLSGRPELGQLHKDGDRFDRSSRQTYPTPCESPAIGGPTAGARGFAIGRS